LVDAGIVEGAIELVVCFDGGFDQSPDVGFVRDIRPHETSGASHRLDEPNGFFSLDDAPPRDDYPGALLREDQGRGAADPGRCAGDECDLALQQAGSPHEWASWHDRLHLSNSGALHTPRAGNPYEWVCRATTTIRVRQTRARAYAVRPARSIHLF